MDLYFRVRTIGQCAVAMTTQDQKLRWSLELVERIGSASERILVWEFFGDPMGHRLTALFARILGVGP